MAEFSTVARPYAEALFQVAKVDEKNFKNWHSLLVSMSGSLQEPKIKDFIASPRHAKSEKVEVLKSFIQKIQAPAEISNLLALLVENDRLTLLAEIAHQFEDLSNQHQKIASAVITTAYALTEQQLKEITSSLEKKFGFSVRATVQVNPEVIGGVRIQIGDEVIDSTIQGQLTKMYRNMVA